MNAAPLTAAHRLTLRIVLALALATLAAVAILQVVR